MIDEHESNDISQSRRKGPFLGEKGPIIWQSRFEVVLLEVAFYVKAGLCRSQARTAFTLKVCYNENYHRGDTT